MKITRNLSKIIVIVLFLLILIVSMLSMLALASEKPILLRYSDHDPPLGLRTKAVQFWLDEIEKQTNGKIKIERFFGGVLLRSNEALNGVRDGVADLAFVYPGFFPKQLLAYEAFRLFPEGPSKWENISWVYNKSFKEIPTFEQEFDKWNQKVLFVTAALPVGFCSSKPLKSLDDMKGVKFYSSNKWVLQYIKNAGAIPITVPWADLYMALQTGTVGGAITNYDGLHMTKLDEAAQNILISKKLWMGTPFCHTINKNIWNSFSKDIQEAILEATRIAEKEFAKAFEEEFDLIVAEERELGYKVNIMTDEDVMKWKNAAELMALPQEWAKEAKEAGVSDADNIINGLREIIKEGIVKDSK